MYNFWLAENIYSGLEHGLISQKLYKAKMKYDKPWSSKVKYLHLLEIISLTYTIPFTDQIASLDIQIDDSIIIGEKVESNFKNGLNNELSSRIYSTLQTCACVCVWSPEQHHPKSS